MTFLRWIYSGILFSLLLVFVGMFGNGTFSVGQASAEDEAKEFSANIKQMEKRFSLATFDLKRKSHLLRKLRMDYFIEQAKQADIRGLDHKRDNLIERADNVLNHHLNQYAQQAVNIVDERNAQPALSE